MTIIFINNIDDGQLISYKLERIINYPKRFTIIGDSIISLEEFGTILSTLIHDGNYSILMRKDGKKISCPDIYILNSFDIKLLIRLPEMIKPDCSPAPMCLCILDILAFDTNHILLYVFGELINPDNELIVFDIKKNKIIASPKLIDKGYPQN